MDALNGILYGLGVAFTFNNLLAAFFPAWDRPRASR